MSFGRKGLVDVPRLTPGQMMALRAMPAAEPQPQSDPDAISPALAAFLAAERARKGPEPGLSEVALDMPRQSSLAGGLSLAKAPAHVANTAMPAPREVIVVHRAERTLLLAYVLWFFTGGFSGHRHYLGRHGSAFAQAGIYWIGMAVGGAAMFSMNIGMLGTGIAIAGGAAWWIIIDAFLIPGMVRKYNEQPSAAAFA